MKCYYASEFTITGPQLSPIPFIHEVDFLNTHYLQITQAQVWQSLHTELAPSPIFPVLLLPLPGFYENSGHIASRVQDLVYLHLCLAVHSLLLFGINDNHIIHYWKLVVPFALGSKSDLVAMMFNFRFMPQSGLNLLKK